MTIIIENKDNNWEEEEEFEFECIYILQCLQIRLDSYFHLAVKY